MTTEDSPKAVTRRAFIIGVIAGGAAAPPQIISSLLLISTAGLTSLLEVTLVRNR